MKAFLRRFKYVIAAVSLCAGAVVPIALQAGPAAAADDSFVISDFTTNPAGYYGGNLTDDLGGLEANLHFEGTVSSGFPFNNAYDNAYFAGDNVWLWYEHGTSSCVTATLFGATTFDAEFTSSACGNGHLYSYWVQYKPWDGQSGSESWANVGATDYVGGNGEYLRDFQVDGGLVLQESAAAKEVSFHTYIG